MGNRVLKTLYDDEGERMPAPSTTPPNRPGRTAIISTPLP
jgi:hypothetical protein